MENVSSSVAELLLLNVNIVRFQFVSIFMVEGQVLKKKKNSKHFLHFELFSQKFKFISENFDSWVQV